MQAITTSLLPSPEHASDVESRYSPSASRLKQVQAETRTSTDFALVTAEGDRVTLSTDSLAQAVYTSYDARGRLRGQRLEVHAESLQRTSSQQSALTIEGDLSQEELEDIQQVLDTLGELASDLFAGKLKKPLSEAIDLDAFDTLSSVDATLEYAHSLTVSQLTQARVGREPTPRLQADTPPVSEQPLTSAKPRNLLKEILQAVDATPNELPKGTARAAKLLDKLAEKFTAPADDDTPKRQAFTRLASRLLQRLSDGEFAGAPDIRRQRHGGQSEAPGVPGD